MDEPTYAGCCELLKRMAELEAQLRAGSQARIECRQVVHPPSANSPQATPPVVKKPTGRKPGHPPLLRVRLHAERLTQPTVHYVPHVDEACQQTLPAAPGPNDPEPRWHQTVELPAIPVHITEHQAHTRTCSCGHVTIGRGFRPRCAPTSAANG